MAQVLTGVNRPDPSTVGSSCPPAPPVAPPAAPPVTSLYGMPGYASSYAMPPSAPMTPAMSPTSAVPPAPSMPVSMPSAPMAGAPTAEQPPRALRLMVKDESGQPRRVAVSPTRHAPGAKLAALYLEEFGLGCIQHQGFFHRRLPDHFIPQGP